MFTIPLGFLNHTPNLDYLPDLAHGDVTIQHLLNRMISASYVFRIQRCTTNPLLSVFLRQHFGLYSKRYYITAHYLSL